MHGFKNNHWKWIPVITLFAGLRTSATAQENDSIQTLDTYVVRADSVANETPLPTYANPVSLLSFAPQVDVQSRGFAEAQGDISIRGGTFENTGVNIAGLALFDPQTGHYLMEVPIDPLMLQAPEVLTGFQNQLNAFNATVGSVHYKWKPVSVSGGQMTLTLGENQLNTQSLYTAFLLRESETSSNTLDFGIAHSESNGTVAYGDHQFHRLSARFQHFSDQVQLQLFAGYQDKFFGWPNLYTPYNVQETEDIQTLLLIGDLTAEFSQNSSLNLATYFRKNRDDYEFDRDRPGLYNPYEHETQVGGFHASWVTNRGESGSHGIIADVFLDSIDSTTLTHSFQSRTYSQIKAYASWLELSDMFGLDLALTYFDTNRNRSTLNPSARLSWSPETSASSASSQYYFEYSEGTQVSGYTAIGSATSGLFAGNPDLDVERSQNIELGYLWQGTNSVFKFATFYRFDRDLTDWTFNFDKQSARTANPVDIDTLGIELFGSLRWKQGILSASYTFMQKDEDYGSADVDASFYALNYPDHRFTLSWIQKLHSRLELRLDSEFRIQEENPLRTSDDTAFLAYASLVIRPLAESNWELRLSVENLFDSDFEEIPAVPASRRQVALQSSLGW